MAAGLCRDVGYWMSLSLLPCPHHAHFNNCLPVSASIQALQACFKGFAGPQSPQTMMEGHKPDPLEGPSGFPWAWCQAALLCCLPSWSGAGSPCCSRATLGENISSLARAFGSRFFLRDAGHVSDTSGNGQTDLPLQHQQPTQNTQGNGLAARQGRAPSPVTDRQTDHPRQRARTAGALTHSLLLG